MPKFSDYWETLAAGSLSAEPLDGAVGGAEIEVSESAPDPLVASTLWVDPSDFSTYLIYDDGEEVAPVQIASPGGGGGGTGTVDTSGAIEANDIARFTDANTIEGRSYSELRADLDLEVGVDVQAYSAVLAATTASFTTADESKLDGIEAGADVTDATNVAAAGAVMESDTSTASMSFVIDEDTMSSNSATKVPTQQSVKAYVDTEIAGVEAGEGLTISPFYVIAANNAPTWAKDRADVVCDGTADQVEIQAALDLGYPVLLTQGTFTISAQINITTLGILRGMGFKTVLSVVSGGYSTGDACVIGSKNHSASLFQIRDLMIDGNYQGVHGIYIYNTTQDTPTPQDPGSDNYGTIENIYLLACNNGSTTRGIWLDDNPDGLRTCNVFNIYGRACDIGMQLDSSDHMVANVQMGASTQTGLYVTGSNNRFTNLKFWFTNQYGIRVTAPRNTFASCEVQDATGIAYQFYGHECYVAGAFANIVSASRATTKAFDIWSEGSSFVGLGVQFSTGSSRTMDEAFDFNTSNNITVIGTIGNPETDFDNTDIIGSEGTGSFIRIARVNAPAYEGITAATVTGTTDTLALADHGKHLSYTNSSLVTVTLANIYTGFECVLKALGAGGLTVATGGMSYANGFTPKKTIAQGETMFVRQTAASTFEITGGTAT